MNGDRFTLRLAGPSDADAVTAVLASAYPGLMAADYDSAVLALALPAMVTANPGLLASGTYYVQQAPSGRIVACGGWTHTEPGTNNVEIGVAHLRHFGTHVDWIRDGLGTAIFERCQQEALIAGVHTFKCFSSIGAEPFYGSLGFHRVERLSVTIGNGMNFPTAVMVRTSRPDMGL